MTIGLPQVRKVSVIKKLLEIKNKKVCHIREFARLIGTLVATKPAVKYGWLHLKNLEREKYIALSLKHNDYNAKMLVPNYLQTEFNWWLNIIPNSKQLIKSRPFKMEIFSDASKTGWGANCGNAKTHGFWTKAETLLHINCLELVAAFNGLKTFARFITNENILLRVDNITAIASINKMGRVQYKYLNKISQEIWDWCESRNIFILASYISSSENIIADSESRIKNVFTEYELNKNVFREITLNLGSPEIDLFASYQNKKCDKFISWHPDPESMCVDAFTINWTRYFFYAFPPFSLIGKVLEKIVNDEATGILVVPDWPSQSWYPQFKELLIKKPLKFPYFKDLLLSPFRLTEETLPRTTLVAGRLFGGLS